MSNNNDTSLPAMDGDIAAHPDSSYAGFSNMSRTPEPSGGASLDEISDHMDGLSEEELEAYMSKWIGEGFTNHTKDIFAHAVLTVTESMNEELEELVGITEVLAERVCELERELIFREVTGEMITTNRERFRAQVEHIEYDDDVSF